MIQINFVKVKRKILLRRSIYTIVEIALIRYSVEGKLFVNNLH